MVFRSAHDHGEFLYDSVLSLGFLVTQTGELTPTLRERVARAVQHRIAGNTSKLVMSGGRAGPEPCTAAEAMRKYAVSTGVPDSDVVEQGDSLDTVGEAIFCRLLLPAPLPGRRLLVVTNNYHADRAGAIFRYIFGAQFDITIDRVPNGPANETASAAEEEKSLQRFRQLFKGIEGGEISAIVDRFWHGHALYQGTYFDDLRRRTSAALAAIKKSQGGHCPCG